MIEWQTMRIELFKMEIEREDVHSYMPLSYRFNNHTQAPFTVSYHLLLPLKLVIKELVIIGFPDIRGTAADQQFVGYLLTQPLT